MRITATFTEHISSDKPSVEFLKEIQWLNPQSHRPDEVDGDTVSIEFVSTPEVIEKIETIGGPSRVEWEIYSITSTGILLYTVPPRIPRDVLLFVPMSNIAAIDRAIDDEVFDAYRTPSQEE